ncbi:DCC1-like thiol-disulfide oxidoreductase family protein, partial [Phycicoccus elongatus]
QVPWREAALGSVGLTSEECRAAVQYVEGGTVVASGADALARAVRSSRTARGRLVGGLVLVPGVRSVARWVYAVVARNRHRLSVLIS